MVVRPGDDIVVLHYVGEGFWKLWVRGTLLEIVQTSKQEVAPEKRQ